MLAVHALSAGAQVACYVVVLALFLIAVIVSTPSTRNPPPFRVRYAAWTMVFVSAGFAVLAFMHLWNAWAAN